MSRLFGVLIYLFLLFPCTLAHSTNLFWRGPFLEAGLGYSYYQNLFRKDGRVILTKISIGEDFFLSDEWQVGIEVGTQSGNNGRLDVPQTDLDLLGGGLTIESTFKPTIDLLLSVKCYPITEKNFFILFKAGGIYRQWQFTRASVNDLARLSPEFQIGLGFDMNTSASIFLSYQLISGKNPNFQVNSEAETGKVSGIPNVHSFILGIRIYSDQGFFS